jgi:hypothetical protein
MYHHSFTSLLTETLSAGFYLQGKKFEDSLLGNLPVIIKVLGFPNEMI